VPSGRRSRRGTYHCTSKKASESLGVSAENLARTLQSRGPSER